MSIIWKSNSNKRVENFERVRKFLKEKKQDNLNYKVLDIGGTVNPWAAEYTDAYLDIQDMPGRKVIVGDIQSADVWQKVREEKFDFIICSHTLEDIRNPDFVDVGANIGLISLYMLKHLPDIKIYAFEPSPHQYSLFQKNISENNLEKHISLYDTALSDKEEKLNFFVHNEANCSGDGFKDTGRGGDGKNISVQALPLDVWWKNNNSPHIDLMKVDTEGAELLVFRGAKKMLEICNPIIIFEMQEVNYKAYNYDWRDVLEFFTSINYSVYTEAGEKMNSDNAEKLMMNNSNLVAKSMK